MEHKLNTEVKKNGTNCIYIYNYIYIIHVTARHCLPACSTYHTHAHGIMKANKLSQIINTYIHVTGTDLASVLCMHADMKII